MRILKAETKGLADDDPAGRAEAQAGRQPLPSSADDDRPSPPPVVDPVERVRDK
jgi:hypothetical protein